MKPTVVVTDLNMPAAKAERVRRLPGVQLVAVPAGELAGAKAALAEATVLYTGGADFNPSDAPQLRWVQTNSAAVSHLLERPVLKAGIIPVANVSGAYSGAVAECTLAMLLAVTRRVPLACRFQAEQRWPDDYLPFQGVDLRNKTLGIVGYGSIGREVARLAQAFGMTVLASKRDPQARRDPHFCRAGTGDPEGLIPRAWFGIDHTAEMLGQSDVAVVALPHTPHTTRLVGRRELTALPRHAIFLSVGRGPVVDEEALVEVLRGGKIAAAALDVFAEEPLPAASPLWTMPNVLILPHIASWTDAQADSAAEVLIENLERHLSGRPLVNVIDQKWKY